MDKWRMVPNEVKFYSSRKATKAITVALNGVKLSNLPSTNTVMLFCFIIFFSKLRIQYRKLLERYRLYHFALKQLWNQKINLHVGGKLWIEKILTVDRSFARPKLFRSVLFFFIKNSMQFSEKVNGEAITFLSSLSLKIISKINLLPQNL